MNSINRSLNLNNCLIETSVGKYSESENPFYNASYDLIKNKNIWKEFNKNWTEKLALVYSWMQRIAGKEFHLKTKKGESFETCIQRCCKEEVIKNGFNLTRNDSLFNLTENNKEKSLIRVFDFLKKVAGQVGASKILHFSFPSLCLMWDNDQIRWLYNTKNRKEVSGSHYVEYHRWAKGIIDSSNSKNSLTQKYEKELPRIFDMCVWAEAKKRNKS